jgi:hypothetical protein
MLECERGLVAYDNELVRVGGEDRFDEFNSLQAIVVVPIVSASGAETVVPSGEPVNACRAVEGINSPGNCFHCLI